MNTQKYIEKWYPAVLNPAETYIYYSYVRGSAAVDIWRIPTSTLAANEWEELGFSSPSIYIGDLLIDSNDFLYLLTFDFYSTRGMVLSKFNMTDGTSNYILLMKNNTDTASYPRNAYRGFLSVDETKLYCFTTGATNATIGIAEFQPSDGSISKLFKIETGQV